MGVYRTDDKEFGHGWGHWNDLGREWRTQPDVLPGCALINGDADPIVPVSHGHGFVSYVTKDSGEREEYESGMRRDTQKGKARFALLWPKGIPYKAQFMTRVAELLDRGADKYGDRNWEKANSQEELDRFAESAERHLAQWLCGERDEDHAAAVVFNLLAYETTQHRIDQVNS